MVQDSVTSAEPSDHLQNLFLVLMSGCGRVFSQPLQEEEECQLGSFLGRKQRSPEAKSSCAQKQGQRMRGDQKHGCFSLQILSSLSSSYIWAPREQARHQESETRDSKRVSERCTACALVFGCPASHVKKGTHVASFSFWGPWNDRL